MELVKGEKLGEGGFGTVYRGLNKATGELVAIKEIRLAGCRDNEIQDILREMHLLQSLNHPHIVRLLGFAKTESTGLIVMEFAPGGSLYSLMREFRTISEDTMRRYTRQLLSGLVYLHSKGVVHRDIKPMNVLISGDGTVKLADFGASRQLSDLSTVATGLMGTPVYMAPEAVRLMKVTRAGDIWSLGCTLLEVLTGNRPWSELGNVPLVSLVFQIGSSKRHPKISCGVSELAADFLLQTFVIDAKCRPTAEQLLLNHPFVEEQQCGDPPNAADGTVQYVTVTSAKNQHDPVIDAAKGGRETETITIDTTSSGSYSSEDYTPPHIEDEDNYDEIDYSQPEDHWTAHSHSSASSTNSSPRERQRSSYANGANWPADKEHAKKKGYGKTEPAGYEMGDAKAPGSYGAHAKLPQPSLHSKQLAPMEHDKAKAKKTSTPPPPLHARTLGQVSLGAQPSSSESLPNVVAPHTSVVKMKKKSGKKA
eukprot:TRINITY_DN4898_c0_g1_i1.p1 TRINITY_DN4898_c0_g1~~TRINITY_DN4898_c0_g1_i1.p1  ORF type:complete len:480 (-),score=121.06 TRINITY_DN4898_c0_g1_i1:81-1520(-)